MIAGFGRTGLDRYNSSRQSYHYSYDRNLSYIYILHIIQYNSPRFSTYMNMFRQHHIALHISVFIGYDNNSPARHCRRAAGRPRSTLNRDAAKDGDIMGIYKSYMIHYMYICAYIEYICVYIYKYTIIYIYISYTLYTYIIYTKIYIVYARYALYTVIHCICIQVYMYI